MSIERGREIFTPLRERAITGGILVAPQIKAELETALGRSMARSSVCNLLHRHGWRKLAPDKQHPQSDPVVQAAWNKTPRNAYAADFRFGRLFPSQADVSRRGALWTHQRYQAMLGTVSDTSLVSGNADPRIYLCLQRGRCRHRRVRLTVLPHVNTGCT